VSPFVTRITPKRDQWIWPVSGMCVVLGFMVMMAWVTESNRRSRFGLLEPGQQRRVNEATVDPDAFRDMSAQLETLSKQNTELQNALGKGKEGTEVLNKQLQAAKAAAGLTKLEGPGLIVTLRDSADSGPKGDLPDIVRSQVNIHDLDVLRVVNELVASGAEAIAVNDHRIAGLSSFRCVGPTILVNDVKIASPVIIKAIGDPATLSGGLNLNDGPLAEIKSTDAKMVTIEVAKSMSVPAFTGRTEFRLGTVPKETS
jgi:uncharacterized protein YlxW (UPF0749 family)